MSERLQNRFTAAAGSHGFLPLFFQMFIRRGGGDLIGLSDGRRLSAPQTVIGQDLDARKIREFQLHAVDAAEMFFSIIAAGDDRAAQDDRTVLFI